MSAPPIPFPVFTAAALAACALLVAGWAMDTARFFALRRETRPDRGPRFLLWWGTAALIAVAGTSSTGGGFPTVGLWDERRFLWVWCAAVFLVLSLWRARLHRRARPLFSLIWLAGLLLAGHTAWRTMGSAPR